MAMGGHKAFGSLQGPVSSHAVEAGFFISKMARQFPTGPGEGWDKPSFGSHWLHSAGAAIRLAKIRHGPRVTGLFLLSGARQRALHDAGSGAEHGIDGDDAKDAQREGEDDKAVPHGEIILSA